MYTGIIVPRYPEVRFEFTTIPSRVVEKLGQKKMIFVTLHLPPRKKLKMKQHVYLYRIATLRRVGRSWVRLDIFPWNFDLRSSHTSDKVHVTRDARLYDVAQDQERWRRGPLLYIISRFLFYNLRQSTIYSIYEHLTNLFNTLAS